MVYTETQIWTAVKAKLAELHELQTEVENSIAHVQDLEAEYGAHEEKKDEQEGSSEGTDKSDEADAATRATKRAELREQLQAAYVKLNEQSKAERK